MMRSINSEKKLILGMLTLEISRYIEYLQLKERVRLELTEPVSSSDFKSDAIDHSAISPNILRKTKCSSRYTLCFPRIYFFMLRKMLIL